MDDRYYLGDGNNYFMYREDKYDMNRFRATLFSKSGDIIDDVSTKDKTHFKIIEYFEARVFMNLVPNKSNEGHFLKLKREGLRFLPLEYLLNFANQVV